MSDTRVATRPYIVGGISSSFVVPAVGGMTFDPAHTDANVTLSNSNLTMLQNNTTGGGGSRSSTSQNTGKFIVELKLDAATAGNHFNGMVGIAPGGQGVGGADIFGGTPTYVSLLVDSGVSYFDGVPGATLSTGPLTVGQTLIIAVDVTNKLFWIKGTDTGNWGSPTLWNGAVNGTQVAAGTGGASFAGLTGPFYVWADAFGTSNGGAGTMGMTLNTNIATFLNTDLPTGYGTWT